MAYGSDIDSNLSPDHRWSFDNDITDQVGSADGTGTGWDYPTTPLCKDVTYAGRSNSTGDRVSIPTTTDINNSAQSRKAVAGWFMVDAAQGPPKRVYGEGNQSTAFHFVLAIGNNVMFEVVEPTNFDIQIFGPYLVPDRVYHLCGIFLGNGYANEAKFFVDGIEMLDASPADRQPDTADLNSRGVAEFADPAGTVGVGEVAVILNGPVNGLYNEWCTWDGAAADLSDNDVRVELFEKGALGDVVITSGTESAMQTSLDTYADTVRDNAACCIEIQAVTGDGDLTLSLDNITFNTLASIHVKYLGTGTLTLTNTNGANATQAKCSAPWGTITVVEAVAITVTVKDINTKAVIEGARAYIEADTGGDLPAGTEIMNKLTNASGVATENLDYTSNQPIVGVVRKGSSSTFYQSASISGTVTSEGYSVTILMIPDE